MRKALRKEKTEDTHAADDANMLDQEDEDRKYRDNQSNDDAPEKTCARKSTGHGKGQQRGRGRGRGRGKKQNKDDNKDNTEPSNAAAAKPEVEDQSQPQEEAPPQTNAEQSTAAEAESATDQEDKAPDTADNATIPSAASKPRKRKTATTQADQDAKKAKLDQAIR